MGLLDLIGPRSLYLDSNVFIYAIEGFEPYRRQLDELFSAIESSAVQAWTSELTLAEVLVRPVQIGDEGVFVVDTADTQLTTPLKN